MKNVIPLPVISIGGFQAWLIKSCVCVLASAKNDPILISYQADGTPMLTRAYKAFIIDEETVTRRVGGKAT